LPTAWREEVPVAETVTKAGLSGPFTASAHIILIWSAAEELEAKLLERRLLKAREVVDLWSALNEPVSFRQLSLDRSDESQSSLDYEAHTPTSYIVSVAPPNKEFARVGPGCAVTDCTPSAPSAPSFSSPLGCQFSFLSTPLFV